MKRWSFRWTAIVLCSLLVCSCKTSSGLYQGKEKSVVILFDNDVHCAIDGYAKLAGMRDAVADTAWTSVVSSGDFLQGGTPGAISKGQYIVDIMKHVGYDAVTLGNHEFDYGTSRMFELLDQLSVPVTSINLYDRETNKQLYTYVIKTVGKKKIAYIGVTTPTALHSESYAFFDERGYQRYDLRPAEVYDLVQQSVDEVRSQGVDYVILLAHLGEDENDMNVDSHGLIRHTTGIDVVLDGHSHSVVHPEWVYNKERKPVLITETGTQFHHVGKLVIMPDGNIFSTLIPTSEIMQKNAKVQHVTDSIKALMHETISQKICYSEVDLRILNDAGRQQVRKDETNAGDIVTDAYRFMTGADLAMTNGGGIRTQLKKGDLTYGDIISLLPYDNYLCLVEVTGEQILELLKANTSGLPVEDGQFPQVSGIKYTAVVADHSIRNVEILNKETNVYEPLDPQKNYLLATIDYCITGGGFRNMLKDAKMVKDAVMLYSDTVVKYITQKLNGHIGMEYAEPQGRITIIH